MREKFIPVSKKDLEARHWQEPDIIIITGDAYVDHPSFGAALISRLLESYGYKVGIIAQPNWRDTSDFKSLGKPRLFFGITSGNVDSMIANYTANKKIRSTDEYSPINKAFARPDRAVIVYANRVREAFKDSPIVIGGLEASMRRLAHYDYWDDSIRKSILIDSRADILVYGMGERQVLEIAERLDKGENPNELDNIRGTAVVRKDISKIKDFVMLPSFEDVTKDTENFAKAFRAAYNEMNPHGAKTVIQKSQDRYVVQFPPSLPLSTPELDKLYELPYRRAWHTDYDKSGGIKALETVKFSLVSHRGCCGECAFCSLFAHQGRIVQSRSVSSIVKEAKIIAEQADFRGTITDVGGPTANLYGATCLLWKEKGFCRGRKCLIPGKCANLKLGYDNCLELYKKIKEVPGIKHVFLGSGLRYDLLVPEYADKYLEEICKNNISGLMKVAPEHSSNKVLALMNKPSFDVYEKFVKKFKDASRKLGKNIFIVNYFISSHPGTSLEETLKLALYLAKRGIKPEQIQDFIPSPMTLSTCMYYTGKDPFTGKKVHVAKTLRERKIQRAFIQYNKKENAKLIREGLAKIGAMHVMGRLVGRHRHPRESGDL